MEAWMKKAWIVIGFFVLIVPLGILVTWSYGDAWGEWGSVSEPRGPPVNTAGARRCPTTTFPAGRTS